MKVSHWHTGLVLLLLFALNTGVGQAQDSASSNEIDLASLYCLVVGISDYEMGKPRGSLERASLHDLQHAHEDALAFQQTLLDCGVAEANIHTLLNSKATKAQLSKELNWLVNADNASGLIFYYSGHGSDNVPDLDRDENAQRPGDRFDEALVPFDALDLYQYDKRKALANPELMKQLLTESIDKLLIDDEIFGFLNKTEVPFVIILDSCFSGGSARGLEEELEVQHKSPNTGIDDELIAIRLIPSYWVSAVFPDLDEGTAPEEPIMLDLPDNAAMLAASTENQTSLEHPDLGGVFTFFLLLALNDAEAQAEADANADGWVDLSEAFSYAKDLTDELTMDIAMAYNNDELYQQPSALNLELAINLKLAER